ncbi:hypothetical protein ACNTMW_10465 [Planosporangium sp. 12N6]|uniref:hypothetical protein n=1 Tax=Planosporangium spinosum TaxID=3402278 RepID=UPI003CFA0097
MAERVDVATARGRRETYDPGRLLGDVMRLLADRGLSPVISTRDLRAAVRSCGSLLLCLGVVPTSRPDLIMLPDSADPGGTAD